MVSDPDLVIRCAGVSKRFGRVVALDGLDLSVPRGSVVGYLGPNGAGKSTTIRILLDLARPDAGEVTVLGVDPRRGGAASRRAIGYLPGELRLDERMTVAETLRSWERLPRDGDRRDVRRRAVQSARLGSTRDTRGLSSGNRRKVGLVGAFMARPELLILDEPTAGIDPLVQAEFLALVAEARDRGATVFLSSHVLSEVQRAADHVVVIRAGQIVAAGSVDEVRHAARQPFVATFVDTPPIGELESTPGVGDVRLRGREVSGVIEGSPNALLALLAKHPLEHLLLPEPDLEDAFLRFYQAERLP